MLLNDADCRDLENLQQTGIEIKSHFLKEARNNTNLHPIILKTNTTACIYYSQKYNRWRGCVRWTYVVKRSMKDYCSQIPKRRSFPKQIIACIRDKQLHGNHKFRREIKFPEVITTQGNHV